MWLESGIFAGRQVLGGRESTREGIKTPGGCLIPATVSRIRLLSRFYGFSLFTYKGSLHPPPPAARPPNSRRLLNCIDPLFIDQRNSFSGCSERKGNQDLLPPPPPFGPGLPEAPQVELWCAKVTVWGLGRALSNSEITGLLTLC